MIGILERCEGVEHKFKTLWSDLTAVRGKMHLRAILKGHKQARWNNLYRIRVYDQQFWLDWLLRKPRTFTELVNPELGVQSFAETRCGANTCLEWASFEWERGSI